MYQLIDFIVKILKRIIPDTWAAPMKPVYHSLLAHYFAWWYQFPARTLTVIGVTGTKGKSTTCDMVYSICTAAGYKTALASTIRFVTPQSDKPNKFKMTMQGRGHLQHLLAQAIREGATHAVVEISSEGLLQGRHCFLFLNALIVTNIHPEHIERHGSFENYVTAKRSIVAELERSPKRPRILVANSDIQETRSFLSADVEVALPFSKTELQGAPTVPLAGDFNRMNALAALKATGALGVEESTARNALASLPQVRGRTEEISMDGITAVVDYAHTAESLEAVYGAYSGRKICILGSTGGGRDRWKRPKMGAVADQMCETVILTNEDPYDEDPRAIVDEIASGMARTPLIIMDRREAIRHAIRLATPDVTVLITGKGTDPYIMGPKGSKTPWSDSAVVREELQKHLAET
jgi:UDP-N-acetylmuramoyl-L-alanyl-D-glutamate--2,6-diaminopimelate ligase